MKKAINMFTFLNIINNWKLYFLTFALIAALATIGVQRYKILKQDNVIQQLQSNALAVEIGTKNLEKQIKRIEQDSAASQAESVQRGSVTMQDDAGETCNDSIKYGIEKAKLLSFHWKNNIP